MVDPRPLRVLSIIDSLGQGGAERSLMDLALRLREHEIDVNLGVLHTPDHGFMGDVRDLGLQVEVLGSNRFGAFVRLRGLVRSGGFDLIHTTLFESSVLGRLGVIGLAVPVVTSLVNVSYDAVRQGDPKVSQMKLRMARMLDGWTARHLTSGFHALTNAVASHATDDLGIDPASVVVIPRGRDPNEFHPVASLDERQTTRHMLGIGSRSQLLLNVARHEYQKGQKDLIRAMPRILAECPDATLVIAGREGNETETLLSEIESTGVGSKVRVLGDRRDVATLLRAADVFVFPSLYEGFGGALVEAIACGLPIVASDLPAIREVLGDAAVLTPPGDSNELALAVVGVLNNPQGAMSMADAGLLRFRQNYQLDEVTNQMAVFFRRFASVR